MQTVVTNTSASTVPISTSPARLSVRGDEGVPVVQASGDWVADQLAVPVVWQALQRSVPGLPPLDTASWDLRQIARLDHTGAQYLWSLWGAHMPNQLEANPDQQALLDRVAQFSAPVPPHSGRGWRGAYFRVGQAVVGVADHAHAALRLLGQLALDTGRLLRHPTRAPWRDISGHLFRIGATALPITALVGFLIGVVLAYLMSQQLRQFGADIFIVNILGIALVRELGPVLAAILIAGRSGSAITAQIGVMRVTEELDAMRVMGIARGFRLVLPRVIAMAVAMPLLAVWTTLAALLGGMLAADLAMGLSPAYFFSALPKTVAIANLGLAVAKSVAFGVLIALIACHYGLRVQPNTQSLGQGTTASVVTSITAVILIDALFAVLFKGVGI
jgi:phospholipid/cholesterol/gamma-HCH transport system permease protein